MTTPPLSKPRRVRRLTAAEAATATPDDAAVTVIDAGANLGFAGGNNVGLAFLLRAAAIDHVWLLNNDTVVEPDAAQALLARMDATYNVGMCGTVVRYYFDPGTLQALNGHRFSVWAGTSRGIEQGKPARTPFDPARIARETDFVLGASLAVSRRFVDAIGPMHEAYFLYYEELDWAYRNAGRFAVAFAHGAVIYHKEGGSIGSSAARGEAQRAVGLLPDVVAPRVRPATYSAHAAVVLAADAGFDRPAAVAAAAEKSVGPDAGAARTALQ